MLHTAFVILLSYFLFGYIKTLCTGGIPGRLAHCWDQGTLQGRARAALLLFTECVNSYRSSPTINSMDKDVVPVMRCHIDEGTGCRCVMRRLGIATQARHPSRAGCTYCSAVIWTSLSFRNRAGMVLSHKHHSSRFEHKCVLCFDLSTVC
ncbi:hypothetical protein F5883DRAFT_551560 [Diaporthe sp. PMI_573]|nr:hypothetical protein F5883DRAFT_551560 [Diaporthaceae sp. PMI_573]